MSLCLASKPSEHAENFRIGRRDNNKCGPREPNCKSENTLLEHKTNFSYDGLYQLIDAWILVLATCVGRVEVSYVKNVALRVIQEMPSPKNPVARRMLGNRLVTTVAMNLSETSHEEEPVVFRLVMGMC